MIHWITWIPVPGGAKVMSTSGCGSRDPGVTDVPGDVTCPICKCLPVVQEGEPDPSPRAPRTPSERLFDRSR